ncbi:hypothetical protein VM1G_04673 [Cytospora mali]|uniref:Uncharacterized protein n=1 Tax=Cytospora mali TaxID=578113 RepID=A0A194VYU1_CYTMA|nr:hypothetical protein VM1G_04673 [Valsa mali]
MVSLGSRSLRARQWSTPLEAVQVMARRGDDTPVIEGFDEIPGVPDLRQDEDNHGLTVVNVSDDDDNDDDDDDADDVTSPSTTPSASETTFATTSLPEVPTTLLPVISSSRTSLAIWETGIPIPISSFSTSTMSSGTAAAQEQPQEPVKHQNDNDSLEKCKQQPSAGLHSTRTEVAIAFGIIGAIGLIVAFIWVAILIRRRRQRHGQDEVGPRDYPSRIGRRQCVNLKFRLPSIPRLPFSFASPLNRFQKPNSSTSLQSQISNPSKPVHISGHREAPPDSSIPNEAAQVPYATTDGGENDVVPQGWLDEKRHDPSYPLPLLCPEPVQQAGIRSSMVSWFKRSSKHHPLRLNPMHRKGSQASATSTFTSRNIKSRPGSMAKSLRANTGYYPLAGEGTVAEGSRRKNGGMLEEIPPMSDLGLQGMFTNNTTTAPSGETVTVPLPAFTREDASAYYRRIWPEPSSGGTSERMSAMSSWTESTMRASTQGGTSRESMEQAGLSPPPGYGNSSPCLNRVTQTTGRPLTASTAGSIGTQAREKEGLSAVYEQT